MSRMVIKESVAKRLGISQEKAKDVIEVVLDEYWKTLFEYFHVLIPGIGKVEIKIRDAGIRWNPLRRDRKFYPMKYYLYVHTSPHFNKRVHDEQKNKSGCVEVSTDVETGTGSF